MKKYRKLSIMKCNIEKSNEPPHTQNLLSDSKEKIASLLYQLIIFDTEK